MPRVKKTNIYGRKKVCQTCDKLLCRTKFHKHYQTEDGKQPHCIDCMNEKIRIGKDNSAMKMERNVAITNGPDADEVHPGTKRRVWFRKNGKMSITYDHKGN